MSDAKEYTVTIGGVEHTMWLDDEDAARYGDAAKPGAAKPGAAKKAPAKVETKARGAQNKARTAANKSGR